MNPAWLAPVKARLEPWKSRWNALDPRDRRVASLLAVFLGIVLFYLLLWLPIEAGLSRSQARLASVEAQLAQVQSQAVLVEGLRATPRGEPPADAASAFQEAAARNGLREQVKRVDAEGARSVRVQIEGAPFPAVMSLLVELHQAGLRAENATIERSPKPGTVNARLLLQAQGA
ncbi:MAG TPA: type II secretion system protein M [Burkholderiales bacterium]|nr:type II secretion system protein M [Burkholderiales bacterium]